MSKVAQLASSAIGFGALWLSKELYELPKQLFKCQIHRGQDSESHYSSLAIFSNNSNSEI